LQAKRTAEEESEYQVFEQLVAEAAIKKDKESKKARKGKDKDVKDKAGWSTAAADGSAAGTPNAPKEKS
jgi:hypothetical protein